MCDALLAAIVCGGGGGAAKRVLGKARGGEREKQRLGGCGKEAGLGGGGEENRGLGLW